MSLVVPENICQGLEVLSSNSLFRSSFLALFKNYFLLIFINARMIKGNTCWYSFLLDKCIIGREYFVIQHPDLTYKGPSLLRSQDHILKNVLTKAQCSFRDENKLCYVHHSQLQFMELFAMFCSYSPISFSFTLGEHKDQLKCIIRITPLH